MCNLLIPSSMVVETCTFRDWISMGFQEETARLR
jgi:hypothetical protein